MITVPDAVSELVRKKPFLEAGLKEGILNLSALARVLQPEVESQVKKSVQEGAILMGLRRLSESLHDEVLVAPPPLLGIGPITVRSNLMEFTYANSATLIDCHSMLLQHIKAIRNVFFTITQGVHETTLIVSSELDGVVKEIFSKERMLSQIETLAALSIHLPENAVDTPGIHYMILKQLAWEHVNIVEEVSTYTEFTIVVKSEDIQDAFGVLNEMVEE